MAEHGRRDYSLLVYSSDNGRSLQQLSQSGHGVEGALPFLLRAIPPMPSLVILRNLSSQIGPQMYVPDRHLYGLVPQALIDEYVFWTSTAPLQPAPEGHVCAPAQAHAAL